MQASDDELYNRFLQGEQDAIDELMIRYGDSLTIFINGYLHNMQDAEDMMIEAFAKIALKKPSIRQGCFKAYLYKTARNLAGRHHLVSKRLETFSLDDMEEEIAGHRSPEDHALDEEHNSALRLCLERIDPELKQVLWLVYIEDMSYEEAAQIMGVSRKKIDNLLYKGKERMRAELDKEGIKS
ncbi:MAG: RNA polymerase sigma factor [Lachnospiraceae bacterium]|nr:RNA polymerase sigma factor [Lachnospiraceae bacterium]